MRNTGRLRTSIAGAAILSLLAGCAAVKHGDVLVFATSTKVALDLSASPTTGGTPAVTFGYKREEGVWMPLIVNGRDSSMISEQLWCPAKYKDAKKECIKIPATQVTLFEACIKQDPKRPAPECLASMVQDMKYTGHAQDPKGGTRSDTYSVFASFGGDFGGSTNGAKAALAQFFATGIAAQKLAANPAATQALKAEDIDAQVVTAKNETISAQKLALEAERAQKMKVVTDLETAITDAAIACWTDKHDPFATKADELMKGSLLLPSIHQKDGADLRENIGLVKVDHPKLVEVTNSVCPKS